MYTLITPIGGDAVYLLKEGGIVVHQWKIPDFQPGYGYLLPGGNLLVIQPNRGVQADAVTMRYYVSQTAFNTAA